MSNVYLAIDENVKEYPTEEDFFSPNTVYPEYKWKDKVAKKENKVYALVRECLYLTGYDSANYGLATWNPLGDVINPGDVVLLKPNWVEDKNRNEPEDSRLTCLVTQPAIMRAVVDYVVIALQGSGRIVLGDAPMQGCNLSHVFELADYNQLFEFYREQGIEIEVADLRKYSVTDKYNGVKTRPEITKDTKGARIVALGEKSMHTSKDCYNPAYKVSDYTKESTAIYHHVGKHCYEINQIPLEADVIINMPKPKTHRLAGMTAAQKNFVGITYEKACLPHRTEGDKMHGGDTYLKKSIWKEWMMRFDEKRTHHSVQEQYIRAKLDDIMMKACYVIGTYTSKDKFRIGSWYGNDTIWRTVVDLNYCLLYANKEGVLQDCAQRKIITIADMIICGEKEGPVGPSPKPLGMIMFADNTLLFDRAMCEIMGFRAECLPAFESEQALEMYGYSSKEQLESEKIKVNENIYTVREFRSEKEWNFEPHSCWKGHIEKEYTVEKNFDIKQ